MLRENLRAALERPSGDSRSGNDAWILPNGSPVLASASSDPDAFEYTAVQLKRGDAWPGPILPGADPIMPVHSSDPDVFEETLVQLRDDDLPSVEDARLQAAQMQAQMDQAIA